jgi:hypothetical protein
MGYGDIGGAKVGPIAVREHFAFFFFFFFFFTFSIFYFSNFFNFFPPIASFCDQAKKNWASGANLGGSFVVRLELDT